MVGILVFKMSLLLVLKQSSLIKQEQTCVPEKKVRLFHHLTSIQKYERKNLSELSFFIWNIAFDHCYGDTDQ